MQNTVPVLTNKMTSNSKRSVDPPRPNDVLCGRGGLAPKHIGNQNYRKLIEANLESYASSAKFEKIELAKRIVHTIRTQNPPGRFIKRNKQGIWTELEVKKVIRKTSQTFRDISLELRRTNNDQTSFGSSLSITDSMLSETFTLTPSSTPTQPSALAPTVPEEKAEIAPDDARPVPSDIYISESERDLGKWLEHVDFEKLDRDDGAQATGNGRPLPLPLPLPLQLDIDAVPVEERGRSA